MKYLFVLVIFFQITSRGFSSPKMEIVTFSNGNLTLHGIIYRPPGKGPFPTVLYNHGSAPGMLNNQAAEKLGPLYVKHGFLFFMPYRRGQGLSATAGPYIGDLIQEAKKIGGAKSAEQTMIKLLTTDHLNDQLAALAWLRSQNYVNPKQIVVAGNSFGGIETILALQRESFCSGINASGGSESWEKAPALQELMIKAVREAKAPIFFFQAENDFDLNPNRILTETMKKSGKIFEIKTYLAFGKTKKDGHSFAYQGSTIWENDVFNFLKKHCK